MRRITATAYAFAFCMTVSSALAGECTKPNVLGTSRTLVIDNTSHPRLGAQQYDETLPLADREVVLTFDDGPLGPYTNRILDLLAAECVKATYFLVGTMAQSNPELTRRIQREGHTIGTHSRSHPLTFDSMPLANAEREIDGGIALVKAALGEQGQLAPFFRIPGLARSNQVENALAARSLVTWSVDLSADDWHRGITADDIATRALRRLEARGRGILLLHDIHPATALAMPKILKGLKERGFRVVHVVPAAPGRPKTYSEPQQWAAHGYKRSRVVVAEGGIDPNRPVPNRLSLESAAKPIAAFAPAPAARHVMAAAGEDFRLPRGIWTDEDRAVVPDDVTPPADGIDKDWPGQIRFASLTSPEDAEWPVANPRRAAETIKSEPIKKKTAAPGKAAKRTANACRGDSGASHPRCKKPPAGHQLSLTEQVSPDRLRSLYSF
jgi:peptidoglycan/xylan/chitin deacetylase (PgdA/CDA1 family)